MTNQDPSAISRLERVLAYMAFGVIGISIVAILARLVFSGLLKSTASVWDTVALFPLIGLPLGAVFIIALFVAGVIRRKKEAE